MRTLSRENGTRALFDANFMPRSGDPRRIPLWESAEHEPVAARIAVAGDFLPAGRLGFLPDSGWPEMAGLLAAHFEDVDTSFVNLEAPLDVDALTPRPSNGPEPAASVGAAALEYLARIRVRPVGIANDHTYDFGSAGVERTRNSILGRGMIPLGAAKTLRKAPQAWIWKGPGAVRVGFWAAAKSTRDSATRRKAGIETANIDRALYALECMRYHQARFCVALLHAGSRGTNRPNPAEVEMMDSLAKWGFDIVAASHSRRVSGMKAVENHRGGRSYCFYGLGSLASGFSECDWEREGMVIVAGLSSRGDMVRLEMRPVVLGENGFGEVPPEPISRTISNRFAHLSAEIADGSYGRLFRQDLRQNLIEIRLPDADTLYRNLAKKARLLRIGQMRHLMRRVIG